MVLIGHITHGQNTPHLHLKVRPKEEGTWEGGVEGDAEGEVGERWGRGSRREKKMAAQRRISVGFIAAKMSKEFQLGQLSPFDTNCILIKKRGENA